MKDLVTIFLLIVGGIMSIVALPPLIFAFADGVAAIAATSPMAALTVFVVLMVLLFGVPLSAGLSAKR